MILSAAYHYSLYDAGIKDKESDKFNDHNHLLLTAIKQKQKQNMIEIFFCMRDIINSTM